jgi:hypothetical protein
VPSVNVNVFDDEGGWIACPDLTYRVAKIAIEYEGAHHLDPNLFRRDTRRDQLLARLGWTVLRTSARDLHAGSATLTDASEPSLPATIGAALALASERSKIAISGAENRDSCPLGARLGGSPGSPESADGQLLLM